MAKSKHSQAWLREQERDPYVIAAKKAGYRSRASYKLLEITQKFSILGRGMTVIDLGAAPGGWSQIVGKGVGAEGRVIAVDLLPMAALDNVTVIEGDLSSDEVLNRIMRELNDKKVDLVISDMAPNLSGISEVDQPAAMYLVELALELCRSVLKDGGSFVTKVFEGEGIGDLRIALKRSFSDTANYKPSASRDRSRELYLVNRVYRRL